MSLKMKSNFICVLYISILICLVNSTNQINEINENSQSINSNANSQNNQIISPDIAYQPQISSK